jgi:leader peptidase (prepilin peptidase)/N-methyltransferase
MTPDGVPHLAVTIPVAVIVGLFVGSFLNVVVYRTPLGLSVSRPRSFCPTCDRQLQWWENVPLVSWLALRGRCHTCHQPISARYPLVELSTGVVFGLVTWGWHGTIVAAGYCALAAGMISVGLIELGGKRAPLAVAAIATGIGQAVIVVGAGWQHRWWIVAGSLIGTTLAFAVLSILRAADPECLDPRGHGRSALVLTGCWLGGLGWAPSAVGASMWIVAYLICMVGAWATARQTATASAVPAPSPPIHPVFGTPLVPALAVAMVASLIAGG